MKRIVRIAVILQLLVLLGFMMSTTSGESVLVQQKHQTTTVDTKTDSQCLEANAQRQNPTQSFVAFAKILQASPLKTRSVNFTGFLHPFNVQLLSSNLRHLLYAEFITLVFSNPDIVFPFHYFW